ncbi:hemagglutinin/amebocyte aggregation factor-like isoform X2 [Tigriopus californicus]|uniref:hemagglutinin/amebocyte aggregation factor-like isoform X2 n=1 Tax=Tigriopus californicus TaxID=6832 RepID=UPI0027DA3C54|nr:hemagglutinin/amebocyte aggregation factor-like isoform X2 [Tigriopus californicus]
MCVHVPQLARPCFNYFSLHDDHFEDRIWDWRCQPSGFEFESCSWSGDMNQFDEVLSFECNNGVVTGVESTNSDNYEDRIWNFKCCTKPNLCYSECGVSAPANEYDGPLSYLVDPGYFLTGADSVHSNHYEDRVWKFRTCKITAC